MTWYGALVQGALVGVIGLEYVRDAALLRHAYVLPEHQRSGVGSVLGQHLEQQVQGVSFRYWLGRAGFCGVWKAPKARTRRRARPSRPGAGPRELCLALLATSYPPGRQLAGRATPLAGDGQGR